MAALRLLKYDLDYIKPNKTIGNNFSPNLFSAATQFSISFILHVLACFAGEDAGGTFQFRVLILSIFKQGHEAQ
jgi:hypothetical protein